MKKKNHNVLNAFLVIICIILGVTLYLFPKFKQQPDPTRPSPLLSALGQTFQLKWKQDINQMAQQNLLPKEWKDIKSVKAIIKSNLIKQWKPHLITPVSTTSKGKQHLEILFYSWEQNGKNTVMIQYTLYDLKTGKVLWERARNIQI